MSDLEKAVIDAVITERVPLDEIQNAIRQCDLDRLEKYTMRLDVSSMKKMGFIAESAGVFMDNIYKIIKDDRNYINYYAATKGNKWRLMSDRF